MVRVLIVEDDPSTGALLAQLIKRLWTDAEVSLKADAAAAIEAWKTQGADLVLLDWGLPGMSGIEVLSQIRRSGQKTICVMISGHTERDVILAAREHQVDAFIAKPFGAKELMARLAQIMALPQEAAVTKPRAFTSLTDLVTQQVERGVLTLPVDRELTRAIAGIRDLPKDDRLRLLRRCQLEPGLVFRSLSLANSSQYITGSESAETFEAALQRVGLDGLVNLATEMALHPGSDLTAEYLRTKAETFRREAIGMVQTLTRLSQDLTFDLTMSRNAAMLARVGELSLLQLMQSWVDQGHALDEAECDALILKERARAGNRIKVQWGIPNTIRGRIGAIYLLPVGTVRLDAIIMRIVGLLQDGDPEGQLPRLLSRVGLSDERSESYLARDS